MLYRSTHCRQCGERHTFLVYCTAMIAPIEDMIEYPSCAQHEFQEEMDRKGKTIDGPYWKPVPKEMH